VFGILQSIMRNLVRRYVTVEQRKSDNQGVTEDDVNEIKQDISAFRCELIEVLKNSGMNTSTATGVGQGGKKNRHKERRLMKGFNLASVGGAGATGATAGLGGSISSLVAATGILPGANSGPRSSIHTLNETFCGSSPCPSTHQPGLRSPVTKLAQLARLAGARKVDSKKKWGNLIEAARSAKAVRMWPRSRSRSEDSVNSDCGGNQPQPPVPDESAAGGRFKNRSVLLTHGQVQITENELPEVLEETSIDWELSGRMGIDPNWDKTNSILSPVPSGRQVERTCSEPTNPAAVISGGSTTAAGHSLVTNSTQPTTKRVSINPRCVNLQFDASISDNAGDTVGRKSYNGAPSASATSSSDLIQRIQPSRRNSSGWL